MKFVFISLFFCVGAFAQQKPMAFVTPDSPADVQIQAEQTSPGAVLSRSKLKWAFQIIGARSESFQGFRSQVPALFLTTILGGETVHFILPITEDISNSPHLMVAELASLVLNRSQSVVLLGPSLPGPMPADWIELMGSIDRASAQQDFSDTFTFHSLVSFQMNGRGANRYRFGSLDIAALTQILPALAPPNRITREHPKGTPLLVQLDKGQLGFLLNESADDVSTPVYHSAIQIAREQMSRRLSASQIVRVNICAEF